MCCIISCIIDVICSSIFIIIATCTGIVLSAYFLVNALKHENDEVVEKPIPNCEAYPSTLREQFQSYYVFIFGLFDYHTAKYCCESEGMPLASIGSIEEFEYLQQVINEQHLNISFLKPANYWVSPSRLSKSRKVVINSMNNDVGSNNTVELQVCYKWRLCEKDNWRNYASVLPKNDQCLFVVNPSNGDNGEPDRNGVICEQAIGANAVTRFDVTSTTDNSKPTHAIDETTPATNETEITTIN